MTLAVDWAVKPQHKQTFSHMGQKYLFLWLSEIFLSQLLVSSLDEIAVSNCLSLLYIDAQEQLLQHMFLGSLAQGLEIKK